MKKNLLLLLLIFSITYQAHADANISNVFKIFTYKYDVFNDTYYIFSQGSAVLTGNNTIITNAHVVLDEDNEPIENYEICKTINFKETPECFSVGNLKYYDISKDLALLELDNKLLSNGVQLSNIDLKIGDSVTTYGYPANGGGTISFTTGKISGYDLGKYKIDADIDSGSSGGAAFDGEGKLIGITNSVVVGYTTSGRVIPLEDIKNFIKKQGQLVYYKQGVSDKYRKYFDYINLSIGKKIINNKYFFLKNIQKNNFSVVDIITSANRDVFSYYLESKSGDTNITIDRNIGLSTNIKIKELYKYVSDKVKDEKNIKYVYKEVTLKGKKIIISMMVNKDDKSIKVSFYGETIDFIISGTLNNSKELNSALKLFFNHYILNTNIDDKKDSVSIGGLSVHKTDNLSLGYSVGGDNDYLTFIGFLKTSENNYGLVSFQNYEFNIDEIDEDSTMESMVKYLISYYDEYDTFTIKDSGLVKNSRGNIFGYVGVKSSEENAIMYTVFSYNAYKETNQYSFFLLAFEGNDKNITKSVRSFIDSLEYQGKSIIPVDNIFNVKSLQYMK